MVELLPKINNKILVFDIDGTLCDINKPIKNDLVIVLQKLSKIYQLVLASGKPFGYIAGLLRQIELEKCIVIGENGGTIMYSATFPPKSYYKVKISQNIEKLFIEIRREYIRKFNQTIWFQPNDINLTIFPIDINNIDKIHNFAKQFKNKNINIYYHKDSIDFTPKGFDKGVAIEILLKKLNLTKEDLYVFGDGTNDLPMLRKTSNSFLVNSKIYNFKPKKYFKDYTELKFYLEKEFLS